jgi:hypothetical protein
MTNSEREALIRGELQVVLRHLHSFEEDLGDCGTRFLIADIVAAKKRLTRINALMLGRS